MITEQIYHHEVKSSENTYVWSEDNLEPFEELIVSFNAERPRTGYYLIAIRVNNEEWLPYVYWSAAEQKSFSGRSATLVIDQDMIYPITPSRKFAVCVEAKEGASLSHFHALHAATNKTFESTFPVQSKSIHLPVVGISQLVLDPQFAKRICAATSTTAVIRYLSNTDITPLSFARGAYDQAFDVFGNWVFNVARAYEVLGMEWRCWVQRLENFDRLLEQLHKNIPVVVSVKGQLPGSCLPYNNGHLIAVIGYDPKECQVICMDPAYPKNESTIVRYLIEAFLEAWGARRGLAFIFSKFIEIP